MHQVTHLSFPSCKHLRVWQMHSMKIIYLFIYGCIAAWLYLVPLCNVRDRFSACSFCLSASSSWESLCFSSVERAWPALTKASGVCKERTKRSNTEQLEICVCTLKRSFWLTWSLNMREIISNTCMLHCCSLWADARNLTRSSKPLMWMAHSSLSWTLASSSTFYRRDRDLRRRTGELEDKGEVTFLTI